ncbi:hypothetical protein WOLCODRAFT_79739 [Wolfiporia cocos MD-104 SS10]|uniref:RRM domain-containing protein n=1 Tax=Wolfiporia cocos (strain MD-104) TaxID=742152 RepID=A0A2H3IZD3_WOLCO|nr:hypothetical protein WOLCODRAFT_79739 [Wolfiporia cocos MD-104 SS10]
MASSATSPGAGAGARDTRMQLFVGNLPYRVRWQDLKDLFRRAGAVLRADVALGPDGRSRGHGTVLMARAEEGERAVGMFQGWCWQGRVLEVRKDRLGEDALANATANAALLARHLQAALLARRRSLAASPASRRSLARRGRAPARAPLGARAAGRQLPFHIQWQDMKDLFRQAGAVARADVALGADGRSRGFGTVSFSNEADAERAVRMFNGCVHTPADGPGAHAQP